jgi:hypothetical protein
VHAGLLRPGNDLKRLGRCPVDRGACLEQAAGPRQARVEEQTTRVKQVPSLLVGLLLLPLALRLLCCHARRVVRACTCMGMAA